MQIQPWQTFKLATASEGLGVNQEQLASILADTQEKLGEFTATGAGGAADFDALKNNTKMTDDQIKEFGKTLSGKDGVEAIQLIKNKLDDLGASAQERFVFESLVVIWVICRLFLPMAAQSLTNTVTRLKKQALSKPKKRLSNHNYWQHKRSRLPTKI